MALIKYGRVDKLEYKAFETRDEMGRFAAEEAAAEIKKQISEKGEINMIFAAAPSQNDFLKALTEDKTIDWTKIHAFHMDEYVGLPADAKQGFGNFLKAAIFGKVPFASVDYIDCTAEDPEAECKRYSKLLKEHKCDVLICGIGENGHIAFNDPHVADFKDPKKAKVVSLDDVCRRQQVNDGCFEKLDDVPKFALTLTVPTLMAADAAFCIVPAKTKANAVKRTIYGKISEECPATALRNHDCAKLYLDADSAALI